MAEEYDQTTAFHYAAYRPPLHSKILDECLAVNQKLAVGLDVGCGTGHSSKALLNYCTKVFGIDPSKEMLAKSIQHSNVDYRHYESDNFGFPEDFFDLITFAGSLYYGKSKALLDEVIRVSKNNARIVIYDFELSLEKFFEKLVVPDSNKGSSNYNYKVNFNGLEQSKLKMLNEFEQSLSLEISLENISHLLLSSKDYYSILSHAWGENDIYNKTMQKLQEQFSNETTMVETRSYSVLYQILK